MMQLFGRKTAPVDVFREVLFDQSLAFLRLIPGEESVLEMHEVEDTKAGKYERGRLLLTTLRVIWFSSHASSINLCLGLATVARLDMSTKARSDVPPLHLFTTFKGTKFEFVFTPLTRAQSHLLLQTADLLLRSFNASARFREVRMRANVTTRPQGGGPPELELLEGEGACERVEGVMNLSKDYGQLGALWVTTCRVCWAAQLQENYNCSLPYLQIRNVKKQSTKFGNVMVVETAPQPQKFLLGFQIKPDARLDAILQLVQAMHKAAEARPVFGLCAAEFVDPQCLSEETQAILDAPDDEEAQESTTAVPGDGIAAYYAQGGQHVAEPVFDASIGLTVEAMPKDVTLHSLWSVL